MTFKFAQISRCRQLKKNIQPHTFKDAMMPV